MSKITLTPLSYPGAALTLPLGKKKPLFSGGIAAWDEVPRPRRRAMTEFSGESPLKYTFDVVLNAFPDGDVEPLIGRIMGWAAINGLPYQPTLIKASGPIVYPQVIYFLSKCDQVEESMEFNATGRICRQYLDLELTEYRAPDLVIQTPPPAQAAQQRAPDPPAQRTHTVTSGDTLWAIAASLLGKGQRWQEIADLNGVRDPRALRIGTVLRIPNQ
jgi:LysM repeat protein